MLSENVHIEYYLIDLIGVPLPSQVQTWYFPAILQFVLYFPESILMSHDRLFSSATLLLLVETSVIFIFLSSSTSPISYISFKTEINLQWASLEGYLIIEQFLLQATVSEIIEAFAPHISFPSSSFPSHSDSSF